MADADADDLDGAADLGGTDTGRYRKSQAASDRADHDGCGRSSTCEGCRAGGWSPLAVACEPSAGDCDKATDSGLAAAASEAVMVETPASIFLLACSARAIISSSEC